MEPEGQDAPEGTASDGAVHLEGGFPPGDGEVHLDSDITRQICVQH